MAKPTKLVFESAIEDTDRLQAAQGVRSFRLQLTGPEVVKLPNTANLRDFVAGTPRRRGISHKAIAATIENKPEYFSTLHGGIAIKASGIEIDEGKKIIALTDASIIDGAQTQGQIASYLKECERKGKTPNDFVVKVELTVTRDEGLASEVAVARNVRLPVKDVSRVGRLGLFDEIDRSLQTYFAGTETPFRLAKNETDHGDFVIDPERYLKIVYTVMPVEVSGETNFGAAKGALYKSKARARQKFEALVKDKDSDPQAKQQYRFIRDFGPEAWALAETWISHKGWQGQRLREDTGAIKREANGYYEVADGLLIPVLAALSLFVEKAGTRWKITNLKTKDARTLIAYAVEQLRSTAINGNVSFMGRNNLIYDLMLNKAKEIQADIAARKAAKTDADADTEEERTPEAA